MAHERARAWEKRRTVENCGTGWPATLDAYAAHVLRELARAGKSGTLDTKDWLRAEADKLEDGQ